MRIIRSIVVLQRIVNKACAQGKKIGFVPTMGYVHEGHLSLVRKAKKTCDICVVSIYVNPTQFAVNEDLSNYPRDIYKDSSLLKKESVDILFLPTDNEIYPQGYLTYIDVEEISNCLCGAFRPGHFKGVATIVAKLLNIIGPCVMFLGQKDAQQVAVIKRMVQDLNFPVRIQVIATKREEDGLAMSSRNVYLSPQERQEASIIFKSLTFALRLIQGGQRSTLKISNSITQMITQQSHGKIQYVACVDLNTLEPLKQIHGQVLIAVAIFFGKTRLIDNVTIRINEPRQNKS